jgi:hypothetical protein
MNPVNAGWLLALQQVSFIAMLEAAFVFYSVATGCLVCQGCNYCFAVDVSPSDRLEYALGTNNF